jgi:two-component system, chemotaxis family, protein-glutamate methylesterase/glutaminase
MSMSPVKPLPGDEPLKVLVVDDSLLYRKVLTDLLGEFPMVRVVGSAPNGRIALTRIPTLQPDLITLDVEMPEMDGLEVLKIIQDQGLEVGVIMCSTLTQRGSDTTIAALERGAFDFIAKPEGASLEENRRILRSALAPLVQAFGRRRSIKKILQGHSPPPGQREKGPNPAAAPCRPAGISFRRRHSQVVGIGVSTGGPAALARMLPQLPADLGTPVLIVQHMPPLFTRSLAQSLDARCALKVEEAADGMPIRPNVALIAPGGRHMKVDNGPEPGRKIIRITDAPPENSCRPSVDYLFRSLAEHYGEQTTAVIMTGMGSDGTAGLRLLKSRGAAIIAQDEATCVVYGMPREPVETGLADVVAPLSALAAEICRMVK